jgi:transaldolase
VVQSRPASPALARRASKMKPATDLPAVKLFADGAELSQMIRLARDGAVQGFTTNPTLMRQAGVTDYRRFARQALAEIRGLPISFAVLSDELDEMEGQAREIAAWGANVYAKIPVTNTRGVSTAPVIGALARSGIKVNVTALFTLGQVAGVLAQLSPETPSILSIFAGRIANAGVDPMPIVAGAVGMARRWPACEVLWASPREAFNVIQAEQCGCQIITVTPAMLAGLQTFGKDLTQYSRETVQMFYDDAKAAGYSL